MPKDKIFKQIYRTPTALLALDILDKYLSGISLEDILSELKAEKIVQEKTTIINLMDIMATAFLGRVIQRATPQYRVSLRKKVQAEMQMIKNNFKVSIYEIHNL